ncbi:hypothetical protein ACIQZN_31585 [Streptomyces sp. NPDC097595]|uniref:hypothetical protein n=1 Tax=Streptomyces sp. NPDC097595 TaxID=3366090 RepID=UPI003830556B
MTPTKELAYERFEGQEAARQLDVFIAAYEEVYEEPPYREGPSEVAEFISHYQIYAQRARMRLIIARDGDEVVGFTTDIPLAEGLFEVRMIEPFS